MARCDMAKQDSAFYALHTFEETLTNLLETMQVTTTMNVFNRTGVTLLLMVAVTVATAEELDCAVSGAQQQHVRVQPQSAAEREIMSLERKACEMILAGQVDPMIDAIVSSSGLLFADGGSVVVGKEAQRTMFKEFLKAGFMIEFEPTDAYVSQAGDLAWAYGLYRLVMPDGAEDIGKYVSVWAKENGQWKNVAEMRNSNN